MPVCFQQPFGMFGGCCKATLVVTFGFLPQRAGRWREPRNGTLSLSTRTRALKGSVTQNLPVVKICLHFLHSRLCGPKNTTLIPTCTLEPALAFNLCQTGNDTGLNQIFCVLKSLTGSTENNVPKLGKFNGIFQEEIY